MSGKNPLGLSKEPQAYEGINISVPVGGWAMNRAKRDPTVNDKKSSSGLPYPGGSLWLNTVSLALFYNAGSGIWEAFGAAPINTIIASPQLMSPSNSYISNLGTLVTFTLPLTAQVGQIIQVVGYGAGGWIIDQNAGQTIHSTTANTTTGTGGSLASTNRYNCVEIMCTVANTDWVIMNFSGTLTYV
jgi:hypothetical protein